MRKITTLLFAGLALMLVIGMSACTKEKTTKEKITGTWNVDKSAYKVTFNGHVVEEETEQNAAGDEVTFNEDGSYTSTIDGSQESGTYTLVGDDQITIDGETMNIQELTKKSLIFYFKEVEDNEIFESWLYFSK